MKAYRIGDNKIVFTGSLPETKEEHAVMSESLFNELKAEILNKPFDDLCELQKLAWTNDDLMDQETLFNLQDKLAELTLSIASQISTLKVDSLVAQFPFLYVTEQKGE